MSRMILSQPNPEEINVPFSYNDYLTVAFFPQSSQVSVSVSNATVLTFLAKLSVQDYKLDLAFLNSWHQP